MLLLARSQVECHDVGVVCHSAGEAGEAARDLGANVWTLPMGRAVELGRDVKHVLLLRRIIQAFHPDVVHLHSSKAGVLGRLAARSVGVPVVFSPHNFAYRAYEGSDVARAAYYIVERTLARWTDCLHVVSDDEYESATTHGMSRAERCGKIHNGIELAPLLRLEPPPARTSPVIGTLARLYTQKRLDLFLEALAELRRRGIQFRGLLIGDGPLRGQLLAQIEELGLEDVVELDAMPHGPVGALQRIDIFALTSSHEACPLTVMEAMAAERAVIAAAVGGVPELVTDGCSGLLVPCGDVKSFADALERVVQNIPLRRSLARGGREKARRRFEASIMSGRMEMLYETALQNRSGGNRLAAVASRSASFPRNG